jgi:Protein of unknown function (DUF2958)
MSPLLTARQRAQLLANGRRAARNPDYDPCPVVKLFTPDANATWLLAWIDPEEPDIAFGLCDLGLGFPEIGAVSLRAIAGIRGRLGLPVERDRHWTATERLSGYARRAHEGRSIDG